MATRAADRQTAATESNRDSVLDRRRTPLPRPAERSRLPVALVRRRALPADPRWPTTAADPLRGRWQRPTHRGRCGTRIYLHTDKPHTVA